RSGGVQTRDGGHDDDAQDRHRRAGARIRWRDGMSAEHELSIERVIDAPIASVWKAWTHHLEDWWAPKPWTTKIVEQDLRAGGKSVLDMRGPDGEGGPMEGVFLEV